MDSVAQDIKLDLPCGAFQCACTALPARRPVTRSSLDVATCLRMVAWVGAEAKPACQDSRLSAADETA